MWAKNLFWIVCLNLNQTERAHDTTPIVRLRHLMKTILLNRIDVFRLEMIKNKMVRLIISKQTTTK